MPKQFLSLDRYEKALVKALIRMKKEEDEKEHKRMKRNSGKRGRRR